MFTEKLHVFFRRVSTAKQDLAMQAAADMPFREKLIPEEIIEIDEQAISANKKSVRERPEMQKLISLIKQRRVHTIYAFDRSRLFRDSYEAQEFHDLRVKHGVQLIYTSVGNGTIQATEDQFIEGIYGMMGEMEGKSIARRTQESNRRFPPKKLGYKKEEKKYHHDPDKKQLIIEYFSALPDITNIEELTQFLVQYRKAFNRQDTDLIKLARDPFYAAYDLANGENALPHVEQYVDLRIFYEIQEKVGPLFTEYIDMIHTLEAQNSYQPICGHCKNPIRYRIDVNNNLGYYTCSRNHSKVYIAFQDLRNIVELVLYQAIEHLDSKKLLSHSLNHIRNIRFQIEGLVKEINVQISDIMESIVLNMEDYSKDWKNQAGYKELTVLKEEKQKLIQELEEKELSFEENKTIVRQVKEYLQDTVEQNPNLLYSMFVHQLVIFKDRVDVEMKFFDYLSSIQTEIIYKGDRSA